MKIRPTTLGLAITAVALLGSLAAADPSDGPQVPVALAWGPDGSLRVALRDARQVATVNLTTNLVVSRHDLEFRPTSLAYSEDRSTLFIGGIAGEVVAVGADGQQTPLVRANGRGPTRIVPLIRNRLAVASTWGREVKVIDGSTGRIERSIAVPFNPGAMVRRPDGRLIVADAFGGKLADLDPETGRVRNRVLDGVNLRALAISGDGKELLIAHASQYDAVPVTANNIDWGLVLSSRLTAVRLSEFDADGPGREGAVVTRRRVTLDGSRHGAADPSALAVSPDGGVVLIALSGAHEVLKNDRRTTPTLGDPPDLLPLGHNLRLEALEVGRSPVDALFDPSGQTAVTADAMSDTLTVVTVSDLTVRATIPLGRGQVARTPAQRGEAAFMDGRLALDRWMTCASCHPGGHTNGLNFDTLSDGDYGAAKNTPSLLGVGSTAPYAWTARFAELPAQVHQSLQSSLKGPSAEDRTVEDLTAYLASLVPPTPRLAADDPAVLRGSKVFEARRCESCHKPPLYTSTGVKDVGLDDGAGGHRAFNPPSLLGVGSSAPYLHDGRAATLDDVLENHPAGYKTPLAPGERTDLKSFLDSL